MKEFQRIITDMTALFKQFTGIEQVKLDAAVGNHVATVEECMTKEQSLILKLRGLDKERETWQEKHGYAGMSFKQILSTVSDSEREELNPLFENFNREIRIFQKVNEDSGKVLTNNLHMIQKALEEKTGNIYGEDGKRNAEIKHMTNRKV